MYTNLLSMILVLVFFGMASAESIVCAGHLVTVEPDGAASRGSKENLIMGVRAGLPIRVGFELDFDKDNRPDLTHWTDAIFLTEFENEIFTQFQQIHRQTPVRGKKRVDLSATRQYWTGSIGTNGLLIGHMSDSTEVNTVAVRSYWCVDSRVPRSEWPAQFNK